LRDLRGLQSIAAPERLEHVGAADFDDTPRLPCLATFAPAAATTNRGRRNVECIGAVAAVADDVHQMRGVRHVDRSETRADTVGGARRSPRPFPSSRRRPVRIAAVIAGETSPRMIMRIRSTISSWKISRCSIVRCSACWA
jgi:hypothetical protein